MNFFQLHNIKKCTVFETFTLENKLTFKPRLWVTRGHWKWQ